MIIYDINWDTKTKSFCTVKETNKTKHQPTGQENISANDISNNG